MQAKAISLPYGARKQHAFRDALMADFSALTQFLYGTPERSRRTLWVAVAAMAFGVFLDVQESAGVIHGCAVTAM